MDPQLSTQSWQCSPGPRLLLPAPKKGLNVPEISWKLMSHFPQFSCSWLKNHVSNPTATSLKIHHLTPTWRLGAYDSWMLTPDMVKLWVFDPSPTIFCRKILPQPPLCIGCVSILDIKTTSKSHQNISKPHQTIIFQPFSTHFPPKNSPPPPLSARPSPRDRTLPGNSPKPPGRRSRPRPRDEAETRDFHPSG